jgi:hypothetical protein
VSVTFPQMKERIASKLGVLPVGNSLSPEDANLIEQRCTSLQKQLDALEIAQIDFDEGIDELIDNIIVAMVAALLVDDFQLGEPKRSQIAAEGALGLPVASPAERQLRKILAPTRVSRPVKADYF